MEYLTSKESWIKFVSSLKITEEIIDKETAKKVLYESIIKALKAKIKPSTGILFSGGVDSTLVAYLSKKLGYDLKCYSLGFKDSDDIEYARKIAKEYNLNYKEKIITIEELESAIKQVIKILKTSDFVKISIGSLVYLACKEAKKDKIKILLTGSGTEDTLLGYDKHKKALLNNTLKEETLNGLLSFYDRDLSRDIPIASSLGIKLDSPYLDEQYIRTAMKISNKLKINNQHKKLILRELALSLGLKEEFAFRKKRAAQYGSKIEREIGKLARSSGFKYKEGYLKSLLK